MKKILAAFAMCVLGAAAAFAEDDGGEESVIHSFGMSLPTYERQTWGDLGDGSLHKDKEYTTTGLAFNVFYNKTTIAPNRFSKLRIMEFGYEGFDVGGWEFSTFNTKFTFGWGGAPIVNDRVSFTVHGVFGFGTAIGTGEGIGYGYMTDKKGWVVENNGETVYAINKSDAFFWNLDTFLGVNAQASFRLTDHFGLFAGTKMYINLIGIGVVSQEDSKISYQGETYKVHGEGYPCVIYPGQFNIDFRIGVSLMY